MGLARTTHFSDGRNYLWYVGQFYSIKKHVINWRCLVTFYPSGHLCSFYAGRLQHPWLLCRIGGCRDNNGYSHYLDSTQCKNKNDAAIGIVFTSMFSLGVMGISNLNNSQGNHLDLKDFYLAMYWVFPMKTLYSAALLWCTQLLPSLYFIVIYWSPLSRKFMQKPWAFPPVRFIIFDVDAFLCCGGSLEVSGCDSSCGHADYTGIHRTFAFV